jgi:hypothetical protein
MRYGLSETGNKSINLRDRENRPNDGRAELGRDGRSCRYFPARWGRGVELEMHHLGKRLDRFCEAAIVHVLEEDVAQQSVRVALAQLHFLGLARNTKVKERLQPAVL